MISYYNNAAVAVRAMSESISRAECLILSRQSVALALSVCLAGGLAVSTLCNKLDSLSEKLHMHISQLEFLILTEGQSDSDSDDVGGDCEKGGVREVLDATRYHVDFEADDLTDLAEVLNSNDTPAEVLQVLKHSPAMYDWVVDNHGTRHSRESQLLRKAFPWLALAEFEKPAPKRKCT